MNGKPTIVVLDGDETGQELLVDALRVIHPDALGLDLDFHALRSSRSINRRATSQRRGAPKRPGRCANRARPQSGDDHPRHARRRGIAQSDPSRTIDGTVIVRTGRPHSRRPSVAGHPRSHLGGAHGRRRCLRRAKNGAKAKDEGEVAYRTERIEEASAAALQNMRFFTHGASARVSSEAPSTR